MSAHEAFKLADRVRPSAPESTRAPFDHARHAARPRTAGRHPAAPPAEKPAPTKLAPARPASVPLFGVPMGVKR
jgi:hypothetical protein